MVIDELKARAGFGGVTLEIEIPEKKRRKNELLRGKVNILGGKVIQKIDRLLSFALSFGFAIAIA